MMKIITIKHFKSPTISKTFFLVLSLSKQRYTKTKKLFIILIYIGNLANAQTNLVPNYSFEQLSKPCSNIMGLSANDIANWYSANNTPCSYFNVCANAVNVYPDWSTVPNGEPGYQFPKTGNGFNGACTYCPDPANGVDSINYLSEYISVKLNAPLKANACYYGEFYTSLANGSELGTNRIAMYLTQNTFTTSLGSFTNTIQPQIEWDTTKIFTDTTNWVKISGKFMAQGGEQYLTIGNFKDGNHTKLQVLASNFILPYPNTSRNWAYHYIDDVSLYELPTSQLQNSYVICSNSDSLVLGDTSKIQTRYQWYANGVLLTDTTGQLKIKPIQTTTYVLHTTNCSTSTQTTVVTYSTNCEPPLVTEALEVPNVFTPNGDNVNDVWLINLGLGNTFKSCTVYNRWGLEIQTTTLKQPTTFIWDGRTTSGIECSAGVYFYTLEYTNILGEQKKVNGYISLFR
jgi:gliding motility-associated-like protein